MEMPPPVISVSRNAPPADEAPRTSLSYAKKLPQVLTLLIPGSNRTTSMYRTYTPSPFTYALTAVSVAYGSTATSTRLHSTTGMEGVRAYNFGPYSRLALDRPTSTPPPPSTSASLATSAPPLSLPTMSVTLYVGDEFSIDTAHDYYALYQTVAVNHGFGKHFVEADVQRDYGDGPAVAPSYPAQSRRRLAAMVALVALALAASLARLAAVAMRWPQMQQRRLVVDTLASAVLLFTLVAFWCTYGVWTRQTARTHAAFDWFNAQPLYNSLLIDALYDTHPWPATAVAYIVVWTLSGLVSAVSAAAAVWMHRQPQSSIANKDTLTLLPSFDRREVSVPQQPK